MGTQPNYWMEIVMGNYAKPIKCKTLEEYATAIYERVQRCRQLPMYVFPLDGGYACVPFLSASSAAVEDSPRVICRYTRSITHADILDDLRYESGVAE